MLLETIEFTIEFPKISLKIHTKSDKMAGRFSDICESKNIVVILVSVDLKFTVVQGFELLE